MTTTATVTALEAAARAALRFTETVTETTTALTLADHAATLGTLKTLHGALAQAAVELGAWCHAAPDPDRAALTTPLLDATRVHEDAMAVTDTAVKRLHRTVEDLTRRNRRTRQQEYTTWSGQGQLFDVYDNVISGADRIAATPRTGTADLLQHLHDALEHLARITGHLVTATDRLTEMTTDAFRSLPTEATHTLAARTNDDLIVVAAYTRITQAKYHRVKREVETHLGVGA